MGRWAPFAGIAALRVTHDRPPFFLPTSRVGKLNNEKKWRLSFTPGQNMHYAHNIFLKRKTAAFHVKEFFNCDVLNGMRTSPSILLGDEGA